VWDIASGDAISQLEVANPDDIVLNFASFNSDDSLIAATDGYYSVLIWSPKTGKLLNSFKVPSINILSGFQFNKDGQKILTTSADQTIRIWQQTAP
jgi:WD40 repeat protein